MACLPASLEEDVCHLGTWTLLTYHLVLVEEVFLHEIAEVVERHLEIMVGVFHYDVMDAVAYYLGSS